MAGGWVILHSGGLQKESPSRVVAMSTGTLSMFRCVYHEARHFDLENAVTSAYALHRYRKLEHSYSKPYLSLWFDCHGTSLLCFLVGPQMRCRQLQKIKPSLASGGLATA